MCREPGNAELYDVTRASSPWRRYADASATGGFSKSDAIFGSVEKRGSLRSNCSAGLPAEAAEYRGTRAGSPCHEKGFTLLEMMVVLVLIGLLAGMVSLSTRHFLIKGKQNAARAEIATICQAIETFYATYGRYPTNEEGVAILTQKTDRLPVPLLTQAPIDPWGRPYQYNMPGRTDAYDVICFGADGREGGTGADQDIVSSNLKEAVSDKTGR